MSQASDPPPTTEHPAEEPAPDRTESLAAASPGAATAALGPQGFADVVGQEPMHRRDRVPGFLLRGQEWLITHLEHERRRTIAIIVVLVALLVATAIASARILLTIAGELDLVAYVGLFVVNWVGNGGALVPIPGARYIGLLMIFQQAVTLPAVEVWLVGGTAMALGLLSYYVAGVRSAAIYSSGDHAGAIEAAQEVATSEHPADEPRRRLTARFTRSWAQARERAKPLIERHGVLGMFTLCLVPWPLAAGGAFIGGAMGFGFARFLVASFAAKLALSALVVAAGLLVSDLARAIAAP